MSTRCDGCGTEHNVKRAFITVWNGHVADLCRTCAQPLVDLIDKLASKRWLQP